MQAAEHKPLFRPPKGAPSDRQSREAYPRKKRLGRTSYASKGGTKLSNHIPILKRKVSRETGLRPNTVRKLGGPPALRSGEM